MLRSRLVTGIAVVSAVAVGGVGGALIGVPGLSSAQTFPKSATQIAATDATKKGGPVRSSPLLDAAAKALHLTTQQLLAKLSDGKTTIADVAKQQKVDINTVITAMTNADHTRIGDIVNKPWPKFGGGGGPGRFGGPATAGGPATPGGPAAGPGFGLGGAFGRLGAIALDPVAKALGISPADLKADLAKGQTIAQIAKTKSVDVTNLINTLVTDASKRIDAAVTAGHLKQAEADKLKTSLKTEITNLVNNGFPKGPMGGFGFGGRGHGRGMGGGPGGGPQPGANAGPSSGSTPTTAKPPTA
jgi:hypothetical protein